MDIDYAKLNELPPAEYCAWLDSFMKQSSLKERTRVLGTLICSYAQHLQGKSKNITQLQTKEGDEYFQRFIHTLKTAQDDAKTHGLEDVAEQTEEILGTIQTYLRLIFTDSASQRMLQEILRKPTHREGFLYL
ncbi:hypothetical protein COT72_02225 [archaeon CG10_big_fil_rev_8_21_14_0_10_43_11]|nr:MAG: hypothetical protein COT72_02225 [archaeon CG10_big_fil_rev_8_21_14_0_10_43_11]